MEVGQSSRWWASGNPPPGQTRPQDEQVFINTCEYPERRPAASGVLFRFGCSRSGEDGGDVLAQAERLRSLGQDLDPRLGDEAGVLELRRERAVGGRHRPFVR